MFDAGDWGFDIVQLFVDRTPFWIAHFWRRSPPHLRLKAYLASAVARKVALAFD